MDDQNDQAETETEAVKSENTDSKIQAISKDIREDLKVLNEKLWDLATECKKTDTLEGVFKGEAIANAMLAYRHGEDARMRLGKVLQACGSVNPYDA